MGHSYFDTFSDGASRGIHAPPGTCSISYFKSKMIENMGNPYSSVQNLYIFLLLMNEKKHGTAFSSLTS